jgi:uncharacterized protein YcbK (DUF882 family)
MNEMVDEGRRKALLGLLAGSATLLLPASVSAATSFWDRPRSLDLYRQSTGERATGVYWQNGGLDAVGYQKMCWLLRDVRGGSAIQMNPRLLDLLCAMQAWVAHFGFAGPITILSGYRSPKTNANTEGAARNSMHMYGQAADIRFPGLPMNYLGKLAQHYAAGGVGFYVGSDFVHVDTGRIRSWRK